MADVNLPTDPTDKEVPTDYVGKLAPAYYCRGWNAKRQKYCKLRAGTNTDHLGSGRCRFHGGNHPIKHGQFRRYADITTNRVRELLEEHAARPDPLDLLPEVSLARAMLQDFIERTADGEEASGLAEAIKLTERIANIVEGIERTKAANALSVKDLDILMTNMGLVVRQFVPDEQVYTKIRDGWLAIRI